MMNFFLIDTFDCENNGKMSLNPRKKYLGEEKNYICPQIARHRIAAIAGIEFVRGEQI